MKQSYIIGMSLFCAAALAVTSAVAADPQEKHRKYSKQYQSQQQDEMMSPADRQQQAREQYQLRPESRITIAADYDNDGQFDAFETVYYYDFARVQSASQQRAQKGGTQGMKQQGQQQMTARVSGEISDLRRIRLANSDKDFLVARIDAAQGRPATALLGTEPQLSRLNLSKGDRVTVQGRRGHVNDKSMLIAEQVSAGNRNVSIDLPPTRHLKRAQGEVVSTRTVRFRGFDEEFVVAQVELVNGNRATVNLGPESKVGTLGLQQGDHVKLLVRPGRVGGESAMIAEQIRANGQLVNLPRPQDTERFRG